MSHRTLVARWWLITVFALGLTAAGASAQDWPRYRLDAARTAAVEESLAFPLHRNWVYEPDRHPRPAWPDPVKEPHRMPFDYAPVPVVADGLLYFGSTTDDSVRALDAESGKVRWRFTTGGPVRFAPDIYEGRAYVASDDGYLYCLDASTGKLIWRFHASRTEQMVLGNERMISRRPLRSGVLVDDGVVYTTAGMWPAEGVIVYALDAETGQVIWDNGTTLQYMGQPHGGGHAVTGPTPQGYLALGNDVLLVASGRTVPAAFDRNDGRFLYFDQRTDTDRGHSRGGSWLTVDAAADLYFNMVSRAFRLSTGESADGGGTRYVPEGAVRAGGVHLKGGEGRITAEDADWSAEVEGRARRLAVAGGRLYVSTDAGRIYCFAPGEPSQGNPTIVHPFPAGTETEPGRLTQEVLALLGERRLHRGYALVLGEPEPDLPQALAAATDLHVLQVLGSEDAARTARERLLKSTHLYGSRIAVTHMPEGGGLPFPPYFANIIVGGPGTLGVPAKDVHHVLRPAGGLWLPGPGGTPPDELELRQVAHDDSPLGVVLERGKLPGAFDWDSEEPADGRLRWPLALSWFGGPGPARMVDRHAHGPMPVAANGRYFHLGHHYIIAVDAYNGTELWCRYVPFACIGRGGESNATIKSLSADDENVYLNTGSVVYRLDAQTGRQLGVYGTFDESKRYALDGPKRFEFDVPHSETQAGTLTLTPGKDGLRIELETQDAAVSDSDLWELFFDFRPANRRSDLYEPGDLDVFRVVVQARTGRSFPWLAPITPDHLITRNRMYFTRSRTGELFSVPTEPWAMPGNVAMDPGDPAIRLGVKFEGGEVEDGTRVRVLLPWEDLPAAAEGSPADFAFTATLVSFERRKNIVRTHPFGTDNTAGIFNNGWPAFVLDETAGEAPEPEVGSLGDLPARALEWGRRPARPDAQEAHAPAAFIGDIRNAVTQGRDGLNRQFYQRSYGCGPVVTAARMDVFRSATLGFYDIEDAGGVHHFGGMRPGCGASSLPALGLLISSEASSGCSCSYSFQTSLALAPTDRRRNEDWAVYFEPVELGTRLNRVAVNLGAPGDRRDEEGRLWIGYPRDLAVKTGEALPLPLVMEQDERFDSLRINTDITRVAGTDKPWVYGSCVPGAGRISVNLHFNDPQWSALSVSGTRPPEVDGVLDDPLWDGSHRVELPERATVQLRHDADNLYVGYERPAFVWRPGHWTPGRRTSGEGDASAQGEDRFGLRFAPAGASRWGDIVRFAVSESGERYSSLWPSTADVPRIEGLALDGRPGDWAEEGFRARFGAGVESRFAWDERGLWVLTTFREDAMTNGKMPPRITFVAARPDNMGGDKMRLRIELDEQTWEAIYVRDGGQDVPDVVQVDESRAGELHVIEALMPFEELGIEPGAGAEIALPVFYEPVEDWASYYVTRAAQGNFFGKPHRHRCVARLRLAKRASAPRRVGFSSPASLPVAFFAVGEEPFTGEWTSTVRVTKESFTAELAIPWSDIERFGLDRDALMLNFDPSPTPDDNFEAIQRFDGQARTFRLDDSPPERRLYTVRLHFAELDERVGPGDRVFDVSLQGETALEDLDVLAEASGHRRALVREFRGVPAERMLEITFSPQAEELTETSAPILAGLDIVEERDD